jgi:hypothetical protein
MSLLPWGGRFAMRTQTNLAAATVLELGSGIVRGEALRASATSPNGTYFWELRFAILRFMSARGRVSQP